MRNSAPADPDMVTAARSIQAGDSGQAIAALQRVLGRSPSHPGALNMLGVAQLIAGRPGEAVAALSRAVEVDPNAASLRLNLSRAHEQGGDVTAALAAVEAALAIEPTSPAGLLLQGQLLEKLARPEEALRSYRNLLRVASREGLPPDQAQAFAHARALVEADGHSRKARIDRTLSEGVERVSERAQAYIDNLCGLRRIYAPQPTGPHFPFLPAVEFFDRSLVPWLDELERATDIIRAEMLALIEAPRDDFSPYVQFAATEPLNQWKDLNFSPRWSAFHLWERGARNDANCARCPRTAAFLEALPLLDVPDKGPNVMFSVLQPQTHIPPHTGTTNTRIVVHLPLIVPEDCFLRVGGDRREVVEGRAWAFDDTIEHEAGNGSDKVRAILILDAWNPYLTEDEREVVRRASPQTRL